MAMQVDYDLDKYRTMAEGWDAQPLQFLENYYDFYIHKEDRNVYCLQAPNRVCLVGLMQVPNDTADDAVPQVTTTPLGDANNKAKVKPNTELCSVNGESIKAMMDGRLLGYNPRLQDDPAVVRTKALGYLFMIAPQFEDPIKQLHAFDKVDTLFS
ncbi:hypothetical protein BC940DRAFT_289064 [Gongronella butleri]|nr:hypothetical protein BC940DRAFT_289064 [Gongronella butleri]